MGRRRAPCGTESAYRRHLRLGESVDDSCREAHNELKRQKRREAAPVVAPIAVVEQQLVDGDEPDDMQLIVDTLRQAFKDIAAADPSKLAPIAREFRAAVESTRGPEVPKELSLADQLAEARAARAARASSSDAAAQPR